MQNRDGRSALHAAIENARVDVVELLVLSGADMNLKDVSLHPPDGADLAGGIAEGWCHPTGARSTANGEGPRSWRPLY